VIYIVAATGCVLAPALALTSIDRVVVWSYVLFAGLPLSMMAILLALIHAQNGFAGSVYRTTAIVWAAGALLVLTPFEVWLPSHLAVVIGWARIIATALVAVLFARLSLFAWRIQKKGRIFVALGCGAVALFFGFRAGRYLIPSDAVGMEAASEGLVEFFFDAVFACVLLATGLVGAWLVRWRAHAHPSR
jgi:hypothetical protein